jgi:vitamin B12 transporter
MREDSHPFAEEECAMTRRGTWGVLAMLLWLGSGSAAAEETAQTTPGAAPAAPAGDVRRADPVVVTATRSEQPLEEIGASVTVVPEEAMRVQEYRAVDEVLRTIPGVQVQTSGSPGKLSTIRIRGANPTQVQVLIDGVRVKSLTSGDFDFADLTLDDVERIEVLRGPQSTLYGADAIGGVVNVITKRGQGPPSALLDFEAGNYETFRERAGVSGSTGPWSYSLGASRVDFQGQFDNDEHNVTSANARVGYALPNKGEVSLTGRFQDGHLGIPFATVFPDFDANREQDQQLWLLSLEWRQPWTSMWEHKVRVSAVDETLTLTDEADSAHPFGFTSDISSRRLEAEWYHFIKPVRWTTITLGGEYRNEVGEVKGSYKETIDSWALVLQDQLTLFDRLYLTAGVRYDGNSAFEDKATARVALSYLLKATDTRLKASWGQGFRAPTFNELFFPAFAPCPPFGNPNLKPEESNSWDAGVEQHLWERRIRLAATYFRNDYKNLIQPTLTDPTNFCFEAQNVGKASSEGVEVEGSVMPVDGLVLALAYTYTDSEDRTTGDPLRRVAPNALSVTATWEPLPGLALSGEVLVMSSQFEAPDLPRNPGYTVVNAAAAYRLPIKRWGSLSNVTLHLRATNILNENYSEVAGFPALGTHVVAGIRATFD